MRVGRAFCLVTLLTATLAFVGCEAEEEPYVSPSGQDVAPEEVVDTPSDAVTVNLLIDDNLQGVKLNDAFNWSYSRGYYNHDVHTFDGVSYEIGYNLTVFICDLGAMNGLGNITTFSTPNPAEECAVIKGHGYIFYDGILLDHIYELNEYGDIVNTEVDDALRVAILNDYYNYIGGGRVGEYYCVWVKDVFENGITVQYVVRKTSDVTNS